jgi:hypothetical protein
MRPLINDDIALAAAIRLPAGGAPDRAPGALAVTAALGTATEHG